MSPWSRCGVKRTPEPVRGLMPRNPSTTLPRSINVTEAEKPLRAENSSHEQVSGCFLNSFATPVISKTGATHADSQ